MLCESRDKVVPLVAEERQRQSNVVRNESVRKTGLVDRHGHPEGRVPG